MRAMCGAQLKESKMGILRTKIYGESNVWSTAQRRQDGNFEDKDPWREQCVEHRSKKARWEF